MLLKAKEKSDPKVTFGIFLEIITQKKSLMILKA
jgi:hypothetical protein